MFERVLKGFERVHLCSCIYFMHCNQKKCENKAYQYQSVQRFTEAVAQRCSVKKVFLEILKNSLKNTCARASLLIEERL